jgi:hypothetical protein
VQKSGGRENKKNDMAARVIQEFCSLHPPSLHGRDIMTNLKTPRNSILVCQNQLHASSKEINNGGTKPSRWWPSGKSLGPRGLLPLWSQVRALWLLI